MKLEILESYIDYQGENAISLKAKKRIGKSIVILTKKNDGFYIEDGSDGYCSGTFSKEEVLKIIDELSKWVNAT